MMRKQIAELLKLGPLPGYATDPDPDLIGTYEDLLLSIQPPVTDEEAKALLTLFGPEDCFGLAWTLIYLIESAPGWPTWDWVKDDNEWTAFLRKRVENAESLKKS